jgi:hypothetical protein
MAYLKVLIASLLTAGICLSGTGSAEDAPANASDRTPTGDQQGTTNNKGMQPITGEGKPTPAEVTPVPAAPSAAATQTATSTPSGRLIILDGNPVYVDQNMNIIGKGGSGPGGAKDPTAEQKRKEREEAAARIEKENRILGAIRRLGTAGYREAQIELLGYGKDAVPYLIEAMGNSDSEGNVAPNSYQLGGHNKAVESRASRQRTRGEVCGELLTEMVQNHSNYKGELPTLNQEEWKAWWAANSDKITFGN